MARAPRLKVFRTPIGFHDAYVAAPSQKAALEAWGTGTNLFARGEAEIVTDARLTKEPLASPGTVVKRLRGTAQQHLASLPRGRAGKMTSARSKTPKAKPKPRPSRSNLDRVEAEAAALRERHKKEMGNLEQRAAEIRTEMRALEKKQEAEAARLDRKVERAREAFDRALKDWN